VKFELTILGCNSALPSVKKNTTAQVLNVLERYFLIDCGEGTQLQFKKFKIHSSKINHIFISHLHGDHIFGLIGLISSYSLQGRKNTLFIHSHPKLEQFINNQLEILNTELSYQLKFVHITSNTRQILFEDKLVQVECFPLRHGPTPCVGFLFTEKPKLRSLIKEELDYYNIPIVSRQGIKEGNDFITTEGKTIPNKQLTREAKPSRSYAFCTDTTYYKKNIENIKGVDLLYHEATFGKQDLKLAKKTYHSTTIQAAQMAVDAEAKKLIIGHYSGRINNYENHLSESKEIFQNTILAQDGLVINL